MSYEIDEAAVSAALANIKVSTGGALPEPPPMGTTMLQLDMRGLLQEPHNLLRKNRNEK